MNEQTHILRKSLEKKRKRVLIKLELERERIDLYKYFFKGNQS